MILSGETLIRRYRKFFRISEQTPISEQMVLTHWELERQLTHDLLNTRPEERWETFERCYSQLYQTINWLNKLHGTSTETLEMWRFVLGAPNQKVYEIGSGKGDLISYLAKYGFECRATEITRERGEKHVAEAIPNLTWRVSDGVHLDQFEAQNSYDVVISDQVLEHMHPEDLKTHLESVHCILTEDGRYIFRTPHRFTGPYDVSRVLKFNEPQGMHLKEYTYQDLTAIVKQAGFDQVAYAFVPAKLRSRLSPEQIPQFQRFYLQLLIWVERCLSLIPFHKLRRTLANVLKRIYLFSDSVSLVAVKSAN
jgi:2-polyprenyl-3-methyl-5-hydroxy-6-metoxy-1,4-benzoquinol methylase